jgi:hypothetical protein
VGWKIPDQRKPLGEEAGVGKATLGGTPGLKDLPLSNTRGEYVCQINKSQLAAALVNSLSKQGVFGQRMNRAGDAMRILNRKLTLVEDPATQNVNCVAGCTVELNALETASLLNPLHPGFRLSCVLVESDVGPDDTLFHFEDRFFHNIVQITGLNQKFEVNLAKTVLNEDVSGPDEIRAQFTLVDRSNGRSVVKKSNQVQGHFD